VLPPPPPPRIASADTTKGLFGHRTTEAVVRASGSR
jgi:hypothetical protein